MIGSSNPVKATIIWSRGGMVYATVLETVLRGVSVRVRPRLLWVTRCLRDG